MSIIPWRGKRSEADVGPVGGHPLASLRDEMDRMFERVFREASGLGDMESWPARLGWGPRLDMVESEKDICVSVELPGVDPKDVDVEVEGNVLIIRGEKTQEAEVKEKNYHRVERQYGTFQRHVQLPSSVDPKEVDASFKNGVLKIKLGKKPESRPKKITVRTEGGDSSR